MAIVSHARRYPASVTFRRLSQLSHNQRVALNQARHRGYLTIPAADALAVALGKHPADIWPQWWAALPAPRVHRIEAAK